MRTVLILMALVVLSSPVAAQNTKLWDVASRTQVSGNASMLWFAPTGNPDTWRGVGVGGAVTYSLGDAFSVFGSFDHGFPTLEGGDGHYNFARVMASLKLYPNASSGPSDNALFIAVGRGWFGRSTIKEWGTNEAQIVAARKIQPRLALFASYAHSFATESARQHDLDFIKVGITGRLYP